jgi:pSer/pThr/pTyr-binding forkhead associated (FHA) protein/tetratricopeptide (TPR) repeat protein
MAKIVVFQNGTKVTEETLEAGREYVIGRASQCDLCLDNIEISRQHAKLYFNGEQWVCEVLSRFGKMMVNGSPIESLGLTSGLSFFIPPFELKFEDHPQAKKPSTRFQEESSPEMKNPVEAVLAEQSRPVDGSPAEASQNSLSQKSGSASANTSASISDRTATGASPIKSILLRLNERMEPVEEITLGAGLIEAGRSRSCQIQIKDAKASRKHFTLQFNGFAYILKDLKGANKTYVNGKPVTEHTLQSGDEISVGDERFRFEEINPAFDNLPLALVDTTEPAVIKVMPNYPAGWNQPMPYARSSSSVRKRKSFNPVMLAGLALIGVAAVYQLTTSGGGEPPAPNRGPTSDPTAGAAVPPNFDRLSNEQKKFVDETYNLALNLYTTGKYDLASLEINKILQLLPDYKDARKILALSQEGINRKRDLDLQERRRREQQEIQQKVSDILDECEKLIAARKYAEVEGCVSQTSDLDPENERAQQLISRAQESLTEIKMLQENKAEAARRKQMAYQYFNSAKKAFTEKRYPAAIADFNRVASINFSDTEGIREKAKLGVKTAKDKLIEQSQSIFASGKSALEAKDYKTAIVNLSKALAISPENGDIKSYKERAEKELRQEMKNLYAESVIEENLGNIESAKKKWRTIMEQDLPSDDYFKKAKSKLDKYEK